MFTSILKSVGAYLFSLFMTWVGDLVKAWMVRREHKKIDDAALKRYQDSMGPGKSREERIKNAEDLLNS